MVKTIRAVPWIPYLALAYMHNTVLTPDTIMFEYGSGGSTLYFGQYIQRLISVEHDPEWYDLVKDKIISENITYQLIEPATQAIGDDKSIPSHYMSGPLTADFKRYVSSVDNYDNFDVIFIDGRSRAACLTHAAKKVKPGGWIILDNAERDYYLTNTKHLFEDWESVTFFGHGPHIDWAWKTLFLRAKV